MCEEREKYGLLLSIVCKVKVFKNKELIREGYCIFINKLPGSALSGESIAIGEKVWK